MRADAPAGTVRPNAPRAADRVHEALLPDETGR